MNKKEEMEKSKEGVLDLMVKMRVSPANLAYVTEQLNKMIVYGMSDS